MARKGASQKSSRYAGGGRPVGQKDSPLRDLLKDQVSDLGIVRVNRSRFGATKGQETSREVEISVEGVGPSGESQSFTAAKATSLDKGQTWIVTNLVTGEKVTVTGGLQGLKNYTSEIGKVQYRVGDAALARARKTE